MICCLKLNLNALNQIHFLYYLITYALNIKKARRYSIRTKSSARFTDPILLLNKPFFAFRIFNVLNFV